MATSSSTTSTNNSNNNVIPPITEKMPLIGLGTMDLHNKNTPIQTSIQTAIQSGYRRIDCAPVYFNEEQIGDALHHQLTSNNNNNPDSINNTRDDMFIVSKLPSPYHQPQHVESALRKSLSDLRLDYLDLYLIHWPVAFEPVLPIESTQTRGWSNEDIDDSDNGNKIDPSVSIHETWKAMEHLVDIGLVKYIGVSNFPIMLLHELLSQCRIPPAVNQVEIHPYLQQTNLIKYCNKRGVHVQAYSPLGSRGYKEEDEPDLLSDGVLMEMALKKNVTVSQICLKWALKRGVSVVVKSCNEERQVENLRGSEVVGLSEEDMKVIGGLDRGYRFFRPEDWWGDFGMAVFD